jgi:hypothetical protein
MPHCLTCTHPGARDEAQLLEADQGAQLVQIRELQTKLDKE